MAGNLTRINNNQITDAVSGNTQLGINANTKVQNYSITSTKLANNLTYGSDLTITGNLAVQGNTTAIDTVNVTIEDPMLLLASGQVGSPTVDIGYIGQRGLQNNIAWVWDESLSSFVAVYTDSTAGATNINILAYADIKTGNANITGTLTTGNVTIGNIVGDLNVTGNVQGGNILSNGIASITGNITTANAINTATLSMSGNVTSDFNVTSNIAGGNITTPGLFSATGNIQTGNFFIGDGAYISNINGANVSATKISNGTSYANVATSSGNIDLGINATNIGNFNAAGLSLVGNVNASALNAQDVSLSGNVISALNVTGNATAANVNSVNNVIAGGDVQGANVLATTLSTGQVTYAGAGGILLGNSSLTTDGANVTLGGGDLSVTGNISVLGASGNISTTGNVTASGQISASGNVYGNNIGATNQISAGGNVTVTGNINASTLTGNAVSIWSSAGGLDIELAGNGNVNVNFAHINNLSDPVANNDAATKFYVDSIAAGLDLKASVDLATTVPLDTESMVTNVVYNNGTAGVGATLTITTSSQLVIDTIDLSTLSANARVLIKNELDPAAGTSDAAWNGIYTLTSTGAGGTVLTRSTDFDDEGALGSIPGAFTFDTGGGQAGTGWVCITQNPVVMGTTPILWAQFSGGGTYSGGNAINITGTVISAKFDNSTIGVNGSNQLYIPANAPLVTPNIGAATGTSLSVTGNVDGNNINSTNAISAGGNVVTTNSVNTANLSLTGNVLSTLNVTSDINANNITATSNLSAGGNVIAFNGLNGANLSLSGNIISEINASGNANFVGNVTAANFTTTGSQGNITGANIIAGITLSATGNVEAGNVNSTGNISTSGNVLGGWLWGDGSNITGLSTSASNIANGTSNVEIFVANGNVTFGVNGTNNVLVVSDTVTTAAGNLSAVGNVIANNVNATNEVTANIATITTSGSIGNISFAAANITSNTGLVNIGNGAVSSDFAVVGANANVLYVSTSANSVSVGSNVQTAGATFAINSPDSILMPVGNTSQRPATPATGMLRWNTSLTTLEVWDGVQWAGVGSPTFTLITNEQFEGDGTTVAFTLGGTYTTDSCIVTINGVVQIPITAYAVSGTTITFTEAPLVGDTIDVRELTTTTTVIALANGNTSLTASVGAVTLAGGNLVVNAGGYLVGDGTYLTNVGGGNVIATKISNGTSQANIAGAGGQFYVAVAGGNVLNSTTTETTVTGNLNPSGNLTMSLGNNTNRWSNLYLSGNTIYLGTAVIEANSTTVTISNGAGGSFVVEGSTPNAGNIQTGNISTTGNIVSTNKVTAGILSSTGNIIGVTITGTSLSTTGNVTGSYVFGNGSQLTSVSATIANIANTAYAVSGANVSGTVASATTAGTVTTAAQGNITSVGTLTSLSVSGTVTVGSGIVNGAGNGVGNIGSSSTYFDTVFAKATSAQYADLAEKYTADAEYEPGTVVAFGGSAEVTTSSTDADRRVAGVVSTNPSYIMNGGLEGTVATVALTGRVPTKVTGTVRKGDLMVSNGDGTARAEANPAVGSVIGKALADFDGATGTIEVVVGRF